MKKAVGDILLLPNRILLWINKAEYQIVCCSRFLCRIFDDIGLNIRNHLLGRLGFYYKCSN